MIQPYHLWVYTLEAETCIPMFTGALFATAKLWNQPRCPSMDEWIKIMRYIYMMEEFYSAINNNEISHLLESGEN
jgi:hypothetical protein